MLPRIANAIPVILAQSRQTQSALIRWWATSGCSLMPADQNLEKLPFSEVLPNSKLAVFSRGSAVLSEAVSKKGRVLALADMVSFDSSRLDPCTGSEWSAGLAMLILAFPDVRWAFGTMQGGGPAAEAVRYRHSLGSFRRADHSPLFDATGLRDFVRGAILEKTEETLRPAIPRRAKFAVALDDEPSYARLHSYAAYRNGYRALPVETETLAKEVLEKDGAKTWDTPKLTLEDYFLNYPDRSQDYRVRWSSLESRDKALPQLTAEAYRVFVSTGHRQRPKTQTDFLNQSRLKDLKRSGRGGACVAKPIGGIFALWRSAKLWRRRWLHTERGLAEGFVWPPPEEAKTLGWRRRLAGLLSRIVARWSKRATNDDDKGGGHSAPGGLLLVASTLIERADWHAENAHSLSDALTGAVLAKDAGEILAGMTPTTSLEALAIQQRLETFAECQFQGVQSQSDVKSRVLDLEDNINAIGKMFPPRVRPSAQWNAESMILASLVKVLDEHSQFDEAVVLRNRARFVHRRSWLPRAMSQLFGRWFGRLWVGWLRWVNPLYWMAAYTHALLRSIPVFVSIIVAWLIGLSCLFAMYRGEASKASWEDRWKLGVQDAVSSFFSVGPPLHADSTPEEPTEKEKREQNSEDTRPVLKKDLRKAMEKDQVETQYVLVACLAIVAGCFHVGVFISHLYSIVARK